MQELQQLLQLVADRLGTEATLPKPVSPKTLIDAVRQARGH